MKFQLLELERSRLSSLIDNLKNNQYSDNRLFIYQKSLIELFEKFSDDVNLLKKESITEIEIQEYEKILNFISKSTEYLSDSIFNLIPYETKFCLELVLSEWIDKSNEYIIVTTLQSNNYFFDSFLTFQQALFDLIKVKYNINFTYKLIQISVPKFEVNDFLSNVILYHELGHFIDIYYKISNRITYQISKTYTDKRELHKFEHHFMEHFADIFACQYISNTVYYLLYKAPSEYMNISFPTHPSNNKRIEIIDNFINDNSDTTIKTIKEATATITNRNLQIRYKNIELTDFINLLPNEINENGEIHSLFINGWKLWLNEKDKFLGFSNDKIYKIINNLIEKSISNYIVTTHWKNK